MNNEPKEQSFQNTLDVYFKEHGKDINLYILTPCYGGSCFTHYVTCLLDTIKTLESYDIKVKPEFCNCDSLVPRARNNLIARSMNNKEMTHMIFIDADITWNPLDILKLLYHDKDIIGGIYPLKRYHWNKLSNNTITEWIEKKQQTILKDIISDEDLIACKMVNYNLNYVGNEIKIVNNLIEVKHLATGFMMVKRNAIEHMFKGFPYTKYVDDIGFLTQPENEFAYALFDCGVEHGHYLSEDWMFCERWRKMNKSVFVDVSISLNHTGTETFKGCYLTSLT